MEGKAEAKGQRGKSEGERQIERLLRRCGLVYHYEPPLAVVDRGKVRLWHPDFFLPEYGIVIEYAGLNGEEYEAGLRHKEAVYQEMGIPAIFLRPESFRGYWPARLLGEIEEVERRRYEKLVRVLKSFRR